MQRSEQPMEFGREKFILTLVQILSYQIYFHTATIIFEKNVNQNNTLRVATAQVLSCSIQEGIWSLTFF